MEKNGLGWRTFATIDLYFKSKAARSLYRLLEHLETDGAAEWIQYSVTRTRPDVALQISQLLLGARGWSTTGQRNQVPRYDGERSPLV